MDEESARATLRKVIFNTDVLVWYFRGNERARRFLASVAQPHRAVSSLTMMELIQGCRGRTELHEVKTFMRDSIPLVVHPDEGSCHRAIALLEQHAAPHGLRVVDALIAAAALESGCALATANVKHYRVIANLEVVPFRP